MNNIRPTREHSLFLTKPKMHSPCHKKYAYIQSLELSRIKGINGFRRKVCINSINVCPVTKEDCNFILTLS